MKVTSDSIFFRSGLIFLLLNVTLLWASGPKVGHNINGFVFDDLAVEENTYYQALYQQYTDPKKYSKDTIEKHTSSLCDGLTQAEEKKISLFIDCSSKEWRKPIGSDDADTSSIPLNSIEKTQDLTDALDLLYVKVYNQIYCESLKKARKKVEQSHCEAGLKVESLKDTEVIKALKSERETALNKKKEDSQKDHQEPCSVDEQDQKLTKLIKLSEELEKIFQELTGQSPIPPQSQLNEVKSHPSSIQIPPQVHEVDPLMTYLGVMCLQCSDEEKKQYTQKFNGLKDKLKEGNPVYDWDEKKQLGQGSYKQVYPGVQLVMESGSIKVIPMAIGKRRNREKDNKTNKKESGENKSISNWNNSIQNELKLINKARQGLREDQQEGLPRYSAVIEKENQKFFAMELYGQGNYGDWAAKKETTSEAKLQALRQASSALTQVHKNGVVHRDLKGENLFMTQDERLVVGDFGLASDGPGKKGTWSGTHGFMPPEVYGENGVQDQPQDVYAFGVIAAQSLKNFTPNPSRISDENLRKQIENNPMKYLKLKSYCKGVSLESSTGKSLQGFDHENCNWKEAAQALYQDVDEYNTQHCQPANRSSSEDQANCKLARVALEALKVQPDQRPQMSKIKEYLDSHHEVEWENSNESSGKGKGH